jgi:hypothetical protein
MGQEQQAIIWIDKALEIDPKNAKALEMKKNLREYEEIIFNVFNSILEFGERWYTEVFIIGVILPLASIAISLFIPFPYKVKTCQVFFLHVALRY